MKIGDLLPADRIVVPLPARTLHDAAEQLIGSFVETGLVSDGSKLIERLAETPARDAVTAGGHAFILHFRSDTVRTMGAAMGVTAEPVSLDPESEPIARVVVVLIAPFKESPTYLLAVSILNRVLGSKELIETIVSKESAGAVHEIEELTNVELPDYLLVHDVMIARPRSVLPDTALGDVARVMIANKLASIPVTSPKGEVLGMVSYRDVLRGIFPSFLREMSEGKGSEQKQIGANEARLLPVREIMDRSVLCVSGDQALANVASMIVGKGMDQIPVVRDGVLVGTLTREDIVRRIFGP